MEESVKSVSQATKPKYALSYYYANRENILQKRRAQRREKRIENGLPADQIGRPRSKAMNVCVPIKLRDDPRVIELLEQLQTLIENN